MAEPSPQASISAKKFAERTGIPRTTLRRLIAADKIPSNPDKSIPMPDGLVALHAIRADLELRPAPVPAAPSAPVGRPARVVSAKEQAALDARAKADAELAAAKLAKEEHRGKLLELDLQRKRGELVDVAEVRADAIAACEVIRQRLLALAPRISAEVEALAAGPAGARAVRIEALIADEVNAALVVLNATRFGGPTH